MMTRQVLVVVVVSCENDPAANHFAPVITVVRIAYCALLFGCWEHEDARFQG